MAAISSNGTGGGLASATITWAGGVVPAEGDSVTVAAGDTVTVDGTYIWGDDSVTAISIYGTLLFSQTVTSSLTTKGSLLVKSGGWLKAGSSVSPLPTGVSATILLNYSAVMASNKYQLIVEAGGNVELFGDKSRVPVSRLTAEYFGNISSFDVASALGWQVGDRLELANLRDTNTYTIPKTQVIQSIAGTTVTVPVVNNATYPLGYHVGNYERNIVIKAFDVVFPCAVHLKHFNSSSDAGVIRTFSYVNAKDGINSSTQPVIGFAIWFPGNFSEGVYTIEGCIFDILSIYNSYKPLLIIDSIIIQWFRQNSDYVTLQNSVVTSGGLTNYGNSEAITCIDCSLNMELYFAGYFLQNCIINFQWNGLRGAVGFTRIVDCTFTHFSGLFFDVEWVTATLIRCKYAVDFFNGNSLAVSDANHYLAYMRSYDSYVGKQITVLGLDDKGDPTFQWVANGQGLRIRDTSIKATSVASIRFDPVSVQSPTVYTTSKFILSGVNTTASVQVRKDSAYTGGSLPTLRVTSSEFDLTSVMSSGVDIFETLSLVTPNMIASGPVTITLEAIGNTGSAWFDDLIIAGEVHDIGQVLFSGGTEISNVIDITDTMKHLTLTGLHLGSEVRLFDVNGVELPVSVTANNESIASSTVDFAYDAAIVDTANLTTVVVMSVQYEYLSFTVMLGNSTSIPIQQRFDRNYNNPV